MIVNYCLVLIKIKHFFLDFEFFPWTFQQNIDIVFANEHRVLFKKTFALNLLFRPVTQFSGVWGGGGAGRGLVWTYLPLRQDIVEMVTISKVR